MSQAEKAQSVPDGSSYHFHSSQASKSLAFWQSRKKVSLWMKLEYWWLLLGGADKLGHPRGAMDTNHLRNVTPELFFGFGWDRCVPAVSGLSLPIQASWWWAARLKAWWVLLPTALACFASLLPCAGRQQQGQGG